METIINFLKNISLQKATLFALILACTSLLVNLGIFFNISSFYDISRFISVLAQGSLVLFFAVLYLKQKGDQ